MDRGLQEMCSQMEINMDALDQPPADEVVIIGNNWPHTAVLLLIETWRSLKEKFECPTIKKKQAWEMVAECLRKEAVNVTWQMCDNKWRHRYKIIRDGHGKTGQGRRKPIYSGKDIIKTIGVHNYCLVFSLMDKN
ncbi:unnamed protein product [Arctogadus glacialis]